MESFMFFFFTHKAHFLVGVVHLAALVFGLFELGPKGRQKWSGAFLQVSALLLSGIFVIEGILGNVYFLPIFANFLLGMTLLHQIGKERRQRGRGDELPDNVRPLASGPRNRTSH
jgi:hypothetical protein